MISTIFASEKFRAIVVEVLAWSVFIGVPAYFVFVWWFLSGAAE